MAHSQATKTRYTLMLIIAYNIKLKRLLATLLIFLILVSAAAATTYKTSLLTVDGQLATFSKASNISSNAGNSSSPQVAVSDNEIVYVVWSDATTGNGDIYFKASSDNGTKFRGKKVLAKNDGLSYEPQIAAADNNIIYAVWKDNTQYDRSQNKSSTNSFDILFRSSFDSGANFANRTTIGKDVGDFADFAEIASVHEKSQAYVVWSDILKYRTPSTYELFFQTITNNSKILTEPINLSNNDGNSITPQIAVSHNNNVYVVWSDATTGNGDIYFTNTT